VSGVYAWLASHPGETIGLASLVVAVVALVYQIRSAKRDRSRRRGGNPERRYTDWFRQTYSFYDNPYLDKREQISLSHTYVALAFQEGSQRRPAAIETLASESNAFVIGDPGSGKSTLLKAFGVRLLEPPSRAERRRRRRREQAQVPIFVPLRRFAKWREQVSHDQPRGLADYIHQQVLGAGAGLAISDASRLFLELLEQARCVVLLDGLDEVATPHYDAVRDAIRLFSDDHRPEMPTARARVIVTCRRHNFLRVRDDWSRGLGSRVYALAPLRDVDIADYVMRQADRFKAADGPARYLAALRGSGMLDLHRTPLVLAMSVGLFAPQQQFVIPNSVVELYHTMIKEMLERHSHLHDRDPGGANRFRYEDKHRLLREFALRAASGVIGFDEFTRDDLIQLATALQPHLRWVLRNTEKDEVVDFVDEIIEHSGLLADISDGERESFLFAHRSIQEYLVADELARLDEAGARILLDRARLFAVNNRDLDWRQVIVFYAAMRDQRQVSPFLHELAVSNLVVAGTCLAGADCTDEVALSILNSLKARLDTTRGEEGSVGPELGALTAATASPRPTVASAAVARMLSFIESVIAASGSTNPSPDGAENQIRAVGDFEAWIRVLTVLADSPTGSVAPIVARIAEVVPGDPRLVEPLWRCLAVPGADDYPEALAVIVESLLNLATDKDGFAEIQRQQPLLRDAITPEVIARAYPIKGALDLGSSFVSLLAIADIHGIAPTDSNEYFRAKATGRLATVQRDITRASVRFLILPVVGSLVAITSAVIVLIDDWPAIYQPHGWWSLLIYLGPQAVLVGAMLYFGEAFIDFMEDRVDVPFISTIQAWLTTAFRRRGRDIEDDKYLIPLFVGVLGVGILTLLSIAVATAPIAKTSILACVVAALLASIVVVLCPIVSAAFEGRVYFLGPANPCVELLIDGKLDQWVHPPLLDDDTADPVSEIIEDVRRS
jgi:hypothetical protein